MKNSNRVRKYNKDDAYKNLDRINFWISNSDSKASFVLAFLGIFIGVLFSSEFLYDILKTIAQILLAFDYKNIIFYLASLSLIILIVFLSLFGIASKYILDSLRPNLDPNHFIEYDIKANSNLHFQSIAEKSFNEFYKENKQLESEEDLIQDIESQVYINSKIATEKFTSFKKAMSFTKWSLLFFALFLIMGTWTMFLVK
ncbi:MULTISPECIES: Pycsar system effector family protein [Bacillus]|uniref:Pycsar effector protein domain-containing protein n=1 Tax=Bacillus sonorensis TaxID=119858 RepID=A0ABN5ALZ1_9BACI|nr:MULTISPECIES: Pycsar system effector family protein [Bacillus]ASB89330.1 hypothetical protein S101395_02823 [Bacillus sonorensis]MEC0338357.1 DUF5706 domain-containing protein [Bacillus sonorensis]MEC0425214.1 DUF5706 domain-containing protein [Bacillus sonorensis]MEC0460768.1 DUF5706 domain-containing protein [Bacillus sonorensis]MEC0526423.1 DUF5706 domain-containing protein [Bacillus sonorensis]